MQFYTILFYIRIFELRIWLYLQQMKNTVENPLLHVLQSVFDYSSAS